MPKIELRGLKGLGSLSRDEYAKWRRDNSKYLSKYSTYEQEEELYNTQRFVESYGKDVARKFSYPQRLAIEKQDLEQYNNSLIIKTYNDTYSPLRADGTVNPEKGMGNLESFYKYGLMEPQFQMELLESDWKTDPEMDSYVRNKEQDRYDTYTKSGMMATEAGIAGFVSYQVVGKSAEEKIDRGSNQNIIDGIYAKDMEFKANKVSDLVDKNYQQLLNLNDEELKQEFLRTINPVKGEYAGIPQLAAFYDEKGNIKSDEVSELGADEMRRWIAKARVYGSQYEPVTAYDMLDKEAKDYISDHQDWMEYTQALVNDMAIGAAAYTMDKINGMRGLYLSFDNEEVPVYRDEDGHFWGKEYVKGGIYTDPYSGEKIPVTLTYATKSALDAQGIAPDGTTRGRFFNNKYWSDAESTGTFDREEQAIAKSLNGYSPTKAVYKVGENKDYIWEVAKMAQFAAADAVSNLVPIGGAVGLIGKGISYGGKAMTAIKGLNQVSKALEVTGAAIVKAAPAVKQITLGTLSAAGIGHAYGRGIFSESLEGNILGINNQLLSEAEDEFHNSYNSNEAFKNQVDAEVDRAALATLSEYGEEINSLSDEERATLVNSIKQQARRSVVQNYISNDVERKKQSPEYSKEVNDAVESATSAATTTAWTTGLKYALINNFGYRSFLFKDPLKRANSSMSKALETATEGANKRLSIIEKFANATKGIKAKEVGKIMLSQAWGGAWTNFTDELQSAGARRINEDRMAKYLKGDYTAEAEVELFGGIGNNVLSYFAGAGESLSDASTWDAGLVGALGSLTSFAPNVPSISRLATNKEARAEWNKLRAEGKYMEMINMLVSNGVLNTYYDKVIGERQAKAVIDQFNSILDNHEDFQVLGRGLALDMASIDATNPHDKDALEFIKAAQIVDFLYNFSNDRSNKELLGVAQRSSVFQNALETVDKITNGKFTSKDAQEYLTEYYSRNPFVMQSNANNSAALDNIVANAKKLKTGAEVFSKVDEAIRSIENEGKEVSPLVRARLVERFALDQFLGDRIAEVEETISGSGSITAGTTIESFGNERALGSRIGDLSNIASKLSIELDKAKTKKEKADKKVKDYKESRKDPETGNLLLTTSEQKELAKLQAEADAAAMQVRALEEQRKEVSVEKNKLIEMRNSNPERRVLSSEEILRLSPEDRARMLDESNFRNYTEAQQVEITRARATLALRSPQLLDDVHHQALMVQRRRANSSAYSKMVENPEAAAAQLDSETISRHYQYSEALDRRRAEIMSDFIRRLEEAPSKTNKAFEEILFNQLMGFGIGPGIDILKSLRKAKSNRIQRYSHIFDRAIDRLQLQSDVKESIESMKLEDQQSAALTESVGRMITKTSSKQELLDELGTALESPDVNQSDKNLLGKLLNNLEELWSQQSSTTSMTKEERLAAQEEFQKRLSVEAQRRQEAEEAARTEAEKKAVEESLGETTTSEEDERLSSEKRAIESSLESTSKEEDDRLTSERETIEGTPDVIKEATDVQLESPTLEEQAAENPTKVDITPAPVDDSTDQGNTLSKVSNTLLGNPMYGYELNPLKYHGKQVPRRGAKPNDKMNRYFAWMETAGIKLQDIIDTELSDIMKLNPDVFPMFVKYDRNATNDDAMVDFVLLTVEYTQDVADIHNDKNGGVITSDGKQYLVVGTLGFAKPDKAQGDMVRSILKSGQKSWFDAHPSERFFVDTRKHTQIQSISSGRLVRQLATDSEVQIRSISELLADEARNPKGLTMGDLKWGIQYDNKLATVNVSERNTVYPPSDGASNLGSVFLLVEAANGNYIPAYIRPVRYSEINNGRLKSRIDDIFNRLTSTNLAERAKAWKELRQVVDCKKEGNWVLYGDETHNTVTVQVNGVKRPTHDLESPSFDRDKLLRELQEADFRINITTSSLSTEGSLNELDEAGALTTDLAKIGTSGASYNVYAMDADGNPIITAPVESKTPTLDAGSDLTKAQRKLNSERMGNVTYRKDANGNWYTETDKLVTDPRLIEQLNYRNLIRTRDLKPDEVIGIDEIFIINGDKYNPLVLVRRRGNHIFAMSKEGAMRTIVKVSAKLAEKARQERLQKELETGASNDEVILNVSEGDRRKAADEEEDVDLGLGETITEEQVVGQITGNFEVEDTPQQKTAEELVEKITADTADIQLAEDGATYVDSSGRHYARVTSVIAADEFSDGRFEADNPWGLPSTTIGTGIDEFVRDFFDNKIGNRDNLADRYPNASNEQLQEFAKQLDGLKESFRGRGLTIVPRDVTVTGTVEVRTKSGDRRVLDVAGTLDLLAYDKDGNFYIFDMKTNRSVPRGESGRKKGAKWSKQLTLYKQLLQEKYGAVVKGLEIIPIQVDYPAPKGWGNATTEYSKRGGQLYADGKEYRMAEPILHDNIPLPETALHIDFSKLTPAEQAMVRTLEDVAPTKDEKAPVVQSEPIRTGEDINKTGTRPLAELQSEKTTDTALSILRSEKFGKRARALLKAKFPDMPSKTAELERFLQSKRIATTNIPDVEQWLQMIEECK